MRVLRNHLVVWSCLALGVIAIICTIRALSAGDFLRAINFYADGGSTDTLEMRARVPATLTHPQIWADFATAEFLLPVEYRRGHSIERWRSQGIELLAYNWARVSLVLIVFLWLTDRLECRLMYPDECGHRHLSESGHCLGCGVLADWEVG